MNIVFIFGGMPHYYNDVLNYIKRSGVSLSVISPKERGKSLGDNVYETDDGIEFQSIKLNEYKSKDGDLFFNDINSVIKSLNPDVIVVTMAHLPALYKDPSFRKMISNNNIKILLKDHPFRLSKYTDQERLIRRIRITDIPKAQKLARLITIPFLRRFIFSMISPALRFLVIKRRLARLNYYRDIFNFPDGIICYVEEAYEVFGSYGVPRQKIFISRNSTNTDAIFDLLNLRNHNYIHSHTIVHIGRLVEWKRVDLLILSLNELKVKFPDIKLFVLGDGPRKQAWQELSWKLGLQENVQFVGGVYHLEQIYQYFSQSSLYVLAGMGGLSINDAMAFRLPVICSECDGTEKFLVRDGLTGFYFMPDSHLDLANKIETFFSLPNNKKEAMSNRAVQVIREEVNIHTVVASYRNAFDELTKLNRARQ